jgi:hypothetical protein
MRNAFYQGLIWVVLENLLPQYWVGVYEERMQQFSFREPCMRRCQERLCARQEFGLNAKREVEDDECVVCDGLCRKEKLKNVSYAESYDIASPTLSAWQ